MKVTVGIPVYNVEKYIRECLESVVNQTYKDLEVIIVDDCSPDRAGDICDEFAAKDPRIRVIHKEQNEGLAMARETIVQEMSGEAIYWLDSDDYLLENAVELSVKLMKEFNADIVKTILIESENKFAGTYSKEEYLKILLPDGIKSNVIGCLINKDMYKGIHHIAGMNFEDYDTFPKLMGNVEKIIVSVNGTYIYRVLRPGSITVAENAAFKGYFAKSALKRERYRRFKEAFPEECKVVLKQYVDDACMTVLYAKKGMDISERLQQMKELLPDVKSDELIHPYKKWLYQAILKNSAFIPMIKTLHKISGGKRIVKAHFKGMRQNIGK